MSLKVSEHALVKDKLTRLRHKNTQPYQFRQLLTGLTYLLMSEATAHLPLNGVKLETPMMPAEGSLLDQSKIILVPVLRAGIGMVEGALQLLPESPVHYLGIYRNEHTLEPVRYYDKMPDSLNADYALILDPMLATGGTTKAAVDILKSRGVQNIIVVCIVSAPEGIRNVESFYPELPIYAATLDEKLNEKGYILPGLGDAGDRIFNTF